MICTKESILHVVVIDLSRDLGIIFLYENLIVWTTSLLYLIPALIALFVDFLFKKLHLLSDSKYLQTLTFNIISFWNVKYMSYKPGV